MPRNTIVRSGRRSGLEIEIPVMETWEQIGGDMNPGTYGGTIAKADGSSIELLKIQPVREYVGDGEAREVGYPFWTREAYFDLSDLSLDNSDVQSALNSIDMDKDTLRDMKPTQRAMVIAEALLDYGRADEGKGGWSSDIIHQEVKWWGGKVEGASYLADEDAEFRREILGEEEEEEEEEELDEKRSVRAQPRSVRAQPRSVRTPPRSVREQPKMRGVVPVLREKKK